MCYARRRSMSEERAEKFLELFNKGKEFTEELLRENQRLRYRLATLETEQGGASDEEVQRLRAEVQQLTDEKRRIQERVHEVEEETKDFAHGYIEIEEQNNNLANLYVASYQLHSTLDFKEVIQIVQEIVINLIGAEAFAILLDRGAEQQPGQSLRGQLPAPLHARLQGSHPDRAGDRHQSHRRRGLRHPARSRSRTTTWPISTWPATSSTPRSTSRKSSRSCRRSSSISSAPRPSPSCCSTRRRTTCAPSPAKAKMSWPASKTSRPASARAFSAAWPRPARAITSIRTSKAAA